MSERSTNEPPRIRDLYRDYLAGRRSFDEVAGAADEVLAAYAATSPQSQSSATEPSKAPRPPT